MRTAIYLRISSDRKGEQVGVDRQRRLGLEVAERLGATSITFYVDNDSTAIEGKYRADYERLLADIDAGKIDLVLAWHFDRINRDPIQLEQLMAVCRKHSVKFEGITSGRADFETSAGRQIARILSAVSAGEVEHMQERILASKFDAAKAGQFSGGKRRYGWDKSHMVVIPEEAAVVNEIADRVIAKESFRSIALDLNARGIPTSDNGTWNSGKIQTTIERRCNFGIRTHRGAEYPAAWPRIISEDKQRHLEVEPVARTSMSKQRGKYRKHMLKGFIFCGECGNALSIALSKGRDPAWACRTLDYAVRQEGCGQVSRNAPPIDHLITEAVLYRLESGKLQELIEAATADAPLIRELIVEQTAQKQRIQEIADLYATNVMSKDEWTTAKLSATRRLDDLTRRIEGLSASTSLSQLPIGDNLRTAWETNDIHWRRGLLNLVIDRVLVDRRPTKGFKRVTYEHWQFDPDLIRIDWKV